MAHYFRSHNKAFLFIFPQLAITLLFFFWPAIEAFFYSFYYSDPFGLKRHFAFFSNYIDLFRDNAYLHALYFTLLSSAMIAVLTLGLGLMMATLVTRRVRSQAIYKSLFIWPYAVAPAVAAILWRFLCHPGMGWLTVFFANFGIEFNYLKHPAQALWVIVITAAWQQFSYNFLFYFAALKAIPSSILEAAVLDGASPWRRFWQIVFPLLSPITFFLLVMNMIYGFFETFGIIHVLTQGGPGVSTSNLIYKVYQDGFIGMDIGGSSAQSVMLMIVVSLLTLAQFKYIEKKVHY